ncbi:MAG: hypothetical protein WC444_07410 [Candidatus Paceibacterota bacterium]
MVQTGIFMGYPGSTFFFPGGPHCVYEIYDPRYPGYTVWYNNGTWLPSGSPYISMLDSLPLSGGDNYFWLMGRCFIRYNPSSGYTWWISGSEASPTDIVPCNDNYIVYNKTIDAITYVHWYNPGDPWEASPLNLGSLLTTGMNEIYIFHYSGGSLGGGWTGGPMACDTIGDMYVIKYPV